MTDHPHDVRVAARLATYPNVHTERAVTAKVDEEVFERVRVHEDQIVNAADAFFAKQEVHATAADSLEAALRQEIRYVAEDRTQVTPALVRRYEILRRDAEKAIAALEAAKREAEWHRQRASDPYQAYCDLVAKFPNLKRPIVIQ